MIKGMFDTGALPVLERVVQFTSMRHRLISHNIANLSTPHFRPRGLSIKSFQHELGRAIDGRRGRGGIFGGRFQPHDTRQIRFGADRMTAAPEAQRDNLVFHDRNDRSLEHLMQGLAENTMTHNMALQMMKNQFDLIETAIRERM